MINSERGDLIKPIKAFIDLVLYSNLWIALSALAMSAQTQLLLLGRILLTPLLGFVFFATLFLYALHRIIGLQRAVPFQQSGRYFVIRKFKIHITIYAVLSGLLTTYFFFLMPFWLQLACLAPSLLALGYVAPLFGGTRRLRDFHYVKIFMIAIAWSWITVWLPASELHLSGQLPVWIMAFERALFIFAITIPFDIRDLEVDAFNKVKTLPAVLGIRNARWLAQAALLLSLSLVALNTFTSAYSLYTGFALSVSIFLAGLLVYFSGRIKHDYYYTGLVDGSMFFQAAGVITTQLLWIG
jgi:4-hydroxybenzoate polyprenyltransferase